MEFVIERSALLSSLGLAQGIVERRNTIPILGNVLIEHSGANLTVVATDLEVMVRNELGCQPGKPGITTLNARKLYEVVRESAATEVSFKSLEGDWIELRCGRARFKMMGLDARSFPEMPRPGQSTDGKERRRGELKIPGDVLATMIDRTIFAVSQDETRYNLGGVYIEASASNVVRMVATDGHRLALVEREATGFAMGGGAIIPRKGMGELRKLLDAEGEAEIVLTLESQLAWLKRGGTELSMRLVEGEFPDYRGVIPKESKHLVGLKRDELLAAIKRAAIFSSERYHGIKLTLEPGSLTVASTSPELGEASETIDSDFNGAGFSVGFNAAYLLQVLGVLPAESELTLGVSDEVSPGTITTAVDSGYKYVVMPMRL